MSEINGVPTPSPENGQTSNLDITSEKLRKLPTPPYYEDLPDKSMPIDQLENTLRGTDQKEHADGKPHVDYMNEVDSLLGQVKNREPNFYGNNPRDTLRILNKLEKRVRFPGDFMKTNDSMFSLIRGYDAQHMLLMAIETKKARIMQQANREAEEYQKRQIDKRGTADLYKGDIGRRDLFSEVHHDDLFFPEIEGMPVSYFEKGNTDKEMKIREEQQADLTSFAFISDKLLDVEDPYATRKTGKSTTYRESFQKALDDVHTTQSSDQSIQNLNRQRKIFYERVERALFERSSPEDEMSKDPAVQNMIAEMNSLSQKLFEASKDPQKNQDLINEFQGVLKNKDGMSVSKRTKDKLEALLKRPVGDIFESALKGGNLMLRRTLPLKYEVPQDIHMKKKVEVPKDLQELYRLAQEQEKKQKAAAEKKARAEAKKATKADTESKQKPATEPSEIPKPVPPPEVAQQKMGEQPPVQTVKPPQPAKQPAPTPKPATPLKMQPVKPTPSPQAAQQPKPAPRVTPPPAAGGAGDIPPAPKPPTEPAAVSETKDSQTAAAEIPSAPIQSSEEQKIEPDKKPEALAENTQMKQEETKTTPQVEEIETAPLAERSLLRAREIIGLGVLENRMAREGMALGMYQRSSPMSERALMQKIFNSPKRWWQNNINRTALTLRDTRFAIEAGAVAKKVLEIDPAIPLELTPEMLQYAIENGKAARGNKANRKNIRGKNPLRDAWSGFTGIGLNSDQKIALDWLHTEDGKKYITNNALKQSLLEQDNLGRRYALIAKGAPNDDLKMAVESSDSLVLSQSLEEEHREIIELTKQFPELDKQIKELLKTYAQDGFDDKKSEDALKKQAELVTNFNALLRDSWKNTGYKKYIDRNEFASNILELADRTRKGFKQNAQISEQALQQMDITLLTAKAEWGGARGGSHELGDLGFNSVEYFAKRFAKRRYGLGNRELNKGFSITGLGMREKIAMGTENTIQDVLLFGTAYGIGFTQSVGNFTSNSLLRTVLPWTPTIGLTALKEYGIHWHNDGEIKGLFAGRQLNEFAQYSYEKARSRQNPDKAKIREAFDKVTVESRTVDELLNDEVHTLITKEERLTDDEQKKLILHLADIKTRLYLTDTTVSKNGITLKVPQNFIQYREGEENQQMYALRSVLLNGLVKMKTQAGTDAEKLAVDQAFQKAHAVMAAELQMGMKNENHLMTWIREDLAVRDKPISISDDEIRDLRSQISSELHIDRDKALNRQMRRLVRLNMRRSLKAAAVTGLTGVAVGAALNIGAQEVGNMIDNIPKSWDEVQRINMQSGPTGVIGSPLRDWHQAFTDSGRIKPDEAEDFSPLQRAFMWIPRQMRDVTETSRGEIGGVNLHLDPGPSYEEIAQSKIEGTVTEHFKAGDSRIELRLPEHTRIVPDGDTMNLVYTRPDGSEVALLKDAVFDKQGNLIKALEVHKALEIQPQTHIENGPLMWAETKGKEALEDWKQMSQIHLPKGKYWTNDTPWSDESELHFYDSTQLVTDPVTGEQLHTVTLEADKIGIAELADQRINVSDIAKQDGIFFVVRLPGHFDEPVVLDADRGKFTFDPTRNDPVTDIVKGYKGQDILVDGEPLTVGKLSRMIINQKALEDVQEGNLASELRGNTDVFNLGIDGEKGLIQVASFDENDQPNYFAAIRGSGEVQTVDAVSEQVVSNYVKLNINTSFLPEPTGFDQNMKEPNDEIGFDPGNDFLSWVREENLEDFIFPMYGRINLEKSTKPGKREGKQNEFKFDPVDVPVLIPVVPEEKRGFLKRLFKRNKKSPEKTTQEGTQNIQQTQTPPPQQAPTDTQSPVQENQNSLRQLTPEQEKTSRLQVIDAEIERLEQEKVTKPQNRESIQRMQNQWREARNLLTGQQGELNAATSANNPPSQGQTTAESSLQVPLEVVDQKAALDMLSKAEIHASPNIVIENYKMVERNLTIEDLRQRGLQPQYKTSLNGKNIWISEPYQADADGRVAVVGYVENESGQLVARTFYLSNSQGIWRYLPHHTYNWYGKGYSEEAISVPFGLQQALSTIVSRSGSIIKKVDNPRFIFTGTARYSSNLYPPQQVQREIDIKNNQLNQLNKTAPDYQQQQAYVQREIAYLQKMKQHAEAMQGTSISFEQLSKPEQLKGQFYTQKGKVKPEDMKFTEEAQKPIFAKPLKSWKQKSQLYGNVNMEVYPSKDGKLNYLFCRDDEGRVWIGGIEDTTKKITSHAVRSEWIDGGDLMTPGFEYDTQDDNYGDKKNRRDSYVDMRPYLDKIPVIQEYRTARASRTQP